MLRTNLFSTAFAVFIIFIGFLVWSCGRSEATKDAASPSEVNASEATSRIEAISKAAFEHEVEPSSELKASDAADLLATFYADQDSNPRRKPSRGKKKPHKGKKAIKVGCDCSDSTCFEHEIIQIHYFKEDDTEKALVIIGNHCDDAGHAAMGWCDAAVMEKGAEGWQLLNFNRAIGGGSAFGQYGEIEQIFPIAKDGIGIAISFADMGQGMIFQGVEVLVYQNDTFREVATIQTYVDNGGIAMDEEEYECTCQSYAFKPTANEAMFDLRLLQRNCNATSDEDACVGEETAKTTIAFDGNQYVIPDEFQIF